MSKSDHSGHRKDVRERFFAEGLSGFKPHQVLEFLLFFSIPRSDTNPIGHELIDAFGSLSAVFDADYEDLLKVKGVGETSATLIKLIPELSRRYREGLPGDFTTVDCFQTAAGLIIPKFTGLKTEHFYIMTLDKKGLMKKLCPISEGGFTYTDLNMREITAAIIRSGATCVILAHNHPHGLPVPSQEDVTATKQIAEFISNIEADLVDHIIVSGTEAFSMAAHPKYKPIFKPYRHTRRISDNTDDIYYSDKE